MHNARIVIGANYGDEGKGISTDYLAQDWADIVVRFNGGAQAGHTVNRVNEYTGEVERHVFGHFGSASLQDIPTYLGPKFVVNPMYFVKELEKLQALLRSPVIYIHPECYVTTMFDMLVNHIIAKRNNHGTCGAGFNETITRCLDNNIPLTMKDLYHFPESRILDIQRYYLPSRLLQLGLTHKEIQDELKVMDLDLMFEETRKAIDTMLRYSCMRDESILNQYRDVVFEGAQGLKLDEKFGFFPHVTRSRTGIKNAMEIINKVNADSSIEAYYVTRPYITRHGNGPLSFEENMPKWVIDETNVENEYQGPLRYAPFSLLFFERRVGVDYKNYANADVTKNVMVTCMDQMNGEIKTDVGYIFKRFTSMEFLQQIKSSLKCSSVLVSYSKVTPKTMLTI